MTYQEASRRFEISSFIDRIKGMEHLDMLLALDREIRSAENVRISSKAQDRDAAYLQQKYVFALKGLSFLIGAGGGRPAGVSAETLSLFRPLINELVGKGVFKPEILAQL